MTENIEKIVEEAKQLAEQANKKREYITYNSKGVDETTLTRINVDVLDLEIQAVYKQNEAIIKYLQQKK